MPARNPAARLAGSLAELLRYRVVAELVAEALRKLFRVEDPGRPEKQPQMQTLQRVQTNQRGLIGAVNQSKQPAGLAQDVARTRGASARARASKSKSLSSIGGNPAGVSNALILTEPVLISALIPSLMSWPIQATWPILARGGFLPGGRYSASPLV